MKKQELPYKMEQIARFELPDMPTDGAAGPSYKLKCVTMEGTRVEKPCTAQAYADFQKFHPDKKTKVFFYLKINSDGLVFDYNEVIGPPPSGLFKQEMPDGRVIASSDRLIFERKIGDKEFDPVFTPAMVGVSTVAEILAALNHKTDLEVQDQLAGKYTVWEIAQQDGKEVVTVDVGR